MYFDCSCWISSISSRRSTRACRSRTRRIVSSLFGAVENLPVSTTLFAENTDSPLGRILFKGALSVLLTWRLSPSLGIRATSPQTLRLPRDSTPFRARTRSVDTPQSIYKSYPDFILVHILAL